MTMQELLRLQNELLIKNNSALARGTDGSTQLVVNVKKLSEEVKAANDDTAREKEKEATKILTEKLVDLKTAIEKNIVATMKSGGGAALGSAALDKSAKMVTPKGGAAGKLNRILFGQQTTEDVENQSKFGVTKWMNKKLTRRAEEHDYVQDALKHDWANKTNKGETGGVANLANLNMEKAIEKAKKDFAKIKDAEDNLKTKQKKVDDATNSGFGPTKKAVKERDEAAVASAKMDPRLRRGFAEETNHSLKEEAAEKTKKIEETKIAETDKLIGGESEMGKTLKEMLDVQHKQLDALLVMAAEGTGGKGGGLLDTATDLLGKGGKGKMLGKAASFIGKNAGKLGAIGGVAMGAYDAYTGWGDASDAEAKGEITHEEANVKKGEAVGSGVGGAGGAWAGAATGAAIGSVVPVVGTAIGGLIGGALGYWGGSKLGSAAGGALTSAAQGFGAGEAPMVDPMGNPTGEGMISATENNENLKAKHSGGNNTTVVNAPTTINNGGGDKGVSAADIKSPIRNRESSINKYIASRYA